MDRLKTKRSFCRASSSLPATCVMLWGFALLGAGPTAQAIAKAKDARPAEEATSPNVSESANERPAAADAAAAGTSSSPAKAAEASAKAASAPSASPSPAATPTARIAKKSADADPSVRKACDALYPSRLQGDLRAACAAGAKAFAASARKSAQIQCRLTYGASARATMGCLIGALIAEDVAAQKPDFELKRLACAAHYPAHTEVDLYLQESCLTGAFMPRTLGKTNPGACREISPERSFIGPCETGVSLAAEPATAMLASKPEGKPDAKDKSAAGEPVPNSHNRLCDRYFDHRQLHQGYRACLNARGAAIGADGRLNEVIGSCGQVVSDAGSDVEKAACIVGASIFRSLAAGKPTNPRFQKCGEEKVSYDERETLACLAAASFLDFGDKREAEKGCKAVFAAKRSTARGECERAIQQF